MILLILRHRSTLTLPLFYTFNSWCIWSKNYPIGQISHFGYTYFFCLLPGVRRVLLAFVWVWSRNGQATVVAHIPSEQRPRRLVRLWHRSNFYFSKWASIHDVRVHTGVGSQRHLPIWYMTLEVRGWGHNKCQEFLGRHITKQSPHYLFSPFLLHSTPSFQLNNIPLNGPS